ncbi:hypothetical protein THAOC_21235, partial [Thalassiosira oceanica]
ELGRRHGHGDVVRLLRRDVRRGVAGLVPLRPGRGGPRGRGDPRDHRLVYHFNIGSVESFEDKLTHSQQELGVSPRDYVPVQYASETNWGVELLKSAPAIFLIGMTAYMLRGMGGMPGAGGGGRGGMGRDIPDGQEQRQAHQEGGRDRRLQRRGGLHGGEEGDHGVRRLPPGQQPVHEARGEDTQGCAVDGTAGDGQDAAGQGGGGRGERALLQHQRKRLSG